MTLAASGRATKAIGMLFGLSLMIPMALTQASGVRAADDDSCTGWQSTRVPPDTIRVFRKATGVVEVVPFQTYVATVMGMEWPGYLPIAVIEAASVTVKQYGWYYAMEGRHRSSYVSESGECYDVRDTTSDQLYKPGKARVVGKHWTAIGVTWDFHLRKDGRQFLTGYRTGEKGPCAHDATGWKLYARSAIRCAEDLGYSWKEILHAYYGPGLNIVDSDGTIVGNDGQAIGHASIIGSAIEAGSGPHTFDERHEAIEWNGEWRRQRRDYAYRRTLTYSSDTQASAVFTVHARSLQLLGRRNPERGRLRVYIDGELKETVDLYSAHGQPQFPFFSRTWAEDKVRSVRLEVVGTSGSAARRHRRNRDHALGGFWSAVPDARVHVGVQNIDDHVQGRDDEGVEHRHRHQ